MKVELLTLDQIDPYQLARHANDEHINQFLTNSFPYPFTVENAKNFIRFSLNNQQLDFGIVVDDICVGCIGAVFKKDIYEQTCELGYWLSSLYWNKGIMSHVLPMMCEYIFENYYIHKITAQVFKMNFVSSHLLKKCGFKKEGYLYEHVYKNGKYHDIIVYGLIGGSHND